MAKTYAQLQAEIAKLQEQAEQQRQRELAGVIERMREAIAAYGITAADLGLDGSAPVVVCDPARSSGGRAAAKAKPVKATKAKATNRAHLTGPRPVKCMGPNGETWSGWSRVPKWISEHEMRGGHRDEFLVKAA